MFSNKDIERYYDLTEVHYRRLWNLDQSRALHYGYWDESTKTFHEALVNTNKVLASIAAIQPGEKVLDAGCGIGGSSLWLAANRHCQVTGISLSAKQVTKANALAEKEALDTSVTFEQKDYTATGYADASFDVVWAIESVCHADDKKLFINEAYRLLKKGGRLIVADYFTQQQLAGDDKMLVERWLNGWAVKDIPTQSDFNKQLTAAGFSNIEHNNVTANIMRSAKRMYRSYFPGKVAAFVYRLFNPGVTDVSRKNVDTAFYQYRSLQKKLWQYQIVLAHKK